MPADVAIQLFWRSKEVKEGSHALGTKNYEKNNKAFKNSQSHNLGNKAIDLIEKKIVFSRIYYKDCR